ncbi:HCL459Cp [Eremothecium sinecaudum]|uniref:DNA polymerase n=1 Tax=Eremothecium sinecaudum TaxID=45286 RepID=A0A109UYK0_9SACH|nr:HCL459Cp [Eremothecium sinecaudum]AMD19692.1 HCL459Cp [Eremothecium sinecaudum]
MGPVDKLQLLKKLSAARANKSTKEFLDDELDKNNDKVYDIVDNEQFDERRRRELLHDDFVVDDDASGYVDKGVDEWDRRHEEYEDASESEDEGKGKKSKRSKASINELINNTHKTRSVVPQLKKPKSVAIDEFNDILEEFSSEVASTKAITSPFLKGTAGRRRIEKRTSQVAEHSLSSAKKLKIAAVDRSDPMPVLDSSPLKSKYKSSRLDPSSDGAEAPRVNLMVDTIESSPVTLDSKSSPVKRENAKAEDFLDDDSDDEIQFTRRPVRSVAVNREVTFHSTSAASQIVPPPSEKEDQKQYSSPTRAAMSAVFSLKPSYTKEQLVDSATDSCKLYWLDFTELDTSLVLFGKIKTDDNQTISAMVHVTGLYRELYFLPREGKTAMDVHEEIIPLLLDKYGLDNIRAKPETKKYAFELSNIPKESEYLKVLLPYDTPKSKGLVLPPDLSGDSFSNVFGGGASIFESFVLQRRIMGPCWLDIKNGDFNALQNASHCAVDVLVASPTQISPVQQRIDAPALNCISLSVQSVMNPVENKQEIVTLTMAIYTNLPQDKPITEDLKPNEIITLVRPPKGPSFPPGMATLSKKELPNVRMFNTEKAVLNCFCALMKRNDPDVIIGHKLENMSLDILSHRAYDLKIPTFSAFGRRIRKSWPDKFGKNSANMINQFYIRNLFSGRLLCDISNEMGQSLTPKCQSWELGEMYQVTCNKEHKFLDVDYSDAQYHDNANCLVLALKESVHSAVIAAEIAFRIQILSLTKQLTTLAGNAWCQTIGGTRAGRNEYILLHEFYRNNYILPDKETNNERADRQRRLKAMNNTDGEIEPTTSSKKAKYQGGLVFEPEKGLHKNYILVMDFNSLYPSIIQEYNICFTTVDRNPENTDELPEVPSSDMAQGVLPKLLANLVQRRYEVKKLMKTETDPHRKAECDIRQQALKLTANSMYGCLGYVNSRFYAKPLAMLVTNKGREILMNTRQLAESLALKVVYGDTDSVMIDTGCDNYKDAFNIGENFKKLVNERYKLLEIDIDNLFKKLLLHAKKKYAALNASFDKAGNERTILEVKGLDMRRREYCPLSKEVSTYVLNTILSDKDPESALQEIYNYMEDLKAKVENNEIRADKYKINTRLSKDPKSYPNGKTMPAVQVALKMREAGKVIKAGSVITFVITKGSDDPGQDDSNPASRAYPLHEVMNKSNNFVPDPKYYLEKQIFAPVERLLESIESFDIVRLSTSLGLDSRRYINRVGAGGELENPADALQPLESTISDMERFKDTSKLLVSCPSCQNKFPFGGIVASNHYIFSYNGLQCKHCNHLFSPIALSCQLERAIRTHISLYYAGWLTCDDSTCGIITRQISVFGKRCLNEECTGVIRYRYSDKQLYNQLLYFDSLFDINKNKAQLLRPLYLPGDPDEPKEPLSSSQIAALSEQNRELFETSQAVVQKYLNQCGRRYVDIRAIFDFMV